MSILVVGELNPDLILEGYEAFPRPGREVLARGMAMTLGSASAICAVGLARLGHRVSFAGKVGRDAWGEFCCEALRAEGVDVAQVRREEGLRTGISVSLTNATDRALVTYPGAIPELRAEEVRIPEGARHLHLSAFYLQMGLRPGVAGLLKEARRRGMTTSLDPGDDPAEEWGDDLRACLAAVDVFLPNEAELAAITGRACAEEGIREIAAAGPGLTVVKRGGQGCLSLADGHLVRCAAHPVTPLDTTGAGDAFNAGFLHAWLEGRPLAEALRYGCICGALSTRRLGGTAGQPGAAEVEALL